DPGCSRLAELGADYVRREPRLGCGLPNHLGHSLVGRLYPKSAWVDSLMMFGLLAARYGAEAGDAELLEYAASLPGRFASLMQDEGTGLFRHSYRDRPGSAYPRGPVFWARGNGWMAAALPAIRGFLPEGSPGRADAERSLSRLAEALLPLQRPDGWWDTLLGPGGGAYRESSATALVAAGWARSARDGLLDARCAAAARRAYASLVASLGPAGEEPSMREISAPTIPLPLLPRLGYALVPKASDLSYGLAALFLAAVEIERLGGAESAGGGT
ncbi:MAG TPA: glycoside hydrolase family 88 protein, partial [Spirochaetia bacterium]|nr:glycoside hydrolase family 88 protein [Spirochaetia bacterium]